MDKKDGEKRGGRKRIKKAEWTKKKETFREEVLRFMETV